MTETAPARRGFWISPASIIAVVVGLALVAVIVTAVAIRYSGRADHAAATAACTQVAQEPFAADRVQTTTQMIDDIFAEESEEQRAAKVASLGLGGLVDEDGYALWVFGMLGHQPVVCLVPMSKDEVPGIPQFIDAAALEQL